MSIHHSRYDSRVTEASTYKSFSPLPTMPSKTKTKFFMLNNNKFGTKEIERVG